MRSVVIFAGGTGGHIFPALAIAQSFKRLGCKVHWVGAPNSMESKLIPKYGFSLSEVPISGMRGGKFYRWLKLPWMLGISLFKTLKILRLQNPDLVIGMGGYVTGPGGIAAKLLGVPLVVHEQNAVVGLTNFLLAKIATRVCVAFPGTSLKKSVAAQNYFVTGNPVRDDIKVDLLKQVHSPLRVLIIGGSRGAVWINSIIPAVVKACRGKITVWHQAGVDNIEDCQRQYENLGLSERIEAFIDNMSEAYKWSDLVVCRAGALTISELMVVGRPSLLIPYPYAVDDHQTINGEYLVKQGAAFMMQQKDMDMDYLISFFTEIVENPKKLIKMGYAAHQLARLDATEFFVNICLEVNRD